MKHVTILVVEDEEIISRDILTSLENMHYYPCCAVRTSDEAVAKARQFVPDLILMDIGIPGSMDGLDAAKVIRDELEIPVIFVTSHTDDPVIEKAKLVNPYGYVVKPFTDGGLKAAIEIALSRRSAEIVDKERKEQEDTDIILTGDDKELNEKNREYTSLPDVRTLFIKDFFNDIVLFLYTNAEVKEQVFTTFIEECLKTKGTVLFVHSQSKAHKKFLPEIHQGKMRVCRLKTGEMPLVLENISEYGETSVAADQTPLHFIIDFTERCDSEDILSAVDRILTIQNNGVPVKGIIAIAVGTADAGLIKTLSIKVPKVIVTTSSGTVISCPDHSFPSEPLSFLPQPVIDETVKKILEPLVLSLLEKPVSGFDILKEIQNRYNVQIPHARIYTLLYELRKMGYVTTRTEGQARVYYPTETGQLYIRKKLDEFKSAYSHILSDLPDRSAAINSRIKKQD
jgi:CheY-like chemotaxis protein/DNA-binding PadR family transcriptional regulator